MFTSLGLKSPALSVYIGMASQTKVLTVGSSLSILDIFLEANGAAINATTVTFTVTDAADAEAVSSTSALNPSTGKYTGTGTVPTGFQVGTWVINWTILTTGGSTVLASEKFCVQEVSVKVGFTPTSDRTGSVYDCVRIDIGDPEAAVFDDGFLERVLVKAVRRLNRELGLAPTNRGPTGVEGNFGGRRIRVVPITINFGTGVFNPPGDEYEDLIILQMEYIIATGEVAALKRLSATTASGPYATALATVANDDIEVVNADGVKIKIGGGRIQTRAALHRFHVETLGKELMLAKRQFLHRITGNFSKLIW